MEAFISAQMAGAESTVELALAMVQACEISKRAAGAIQVVDAWLEVSHLRIPSVSAACLAVFPFQAISCLLIILVHVR